ncbi:hypothetical protein K432DRAFT_307041 [Lepidopterella palustris CBS 459.81]|uniref:Uncharacterized protein n=1 Tax=Lepidopterella palustris CBS 459.81 TaxID=1314670 RepID=A0A8E2E2G6_9PEZI|nr:hypothetical protein K432DRAFT_307041 [Lepidopterella palustris CBS 459.81]
MFPTQTLLARLHGRPSKSTRPPTNRKLTEEQESALCQYLNTLEGMCTSATRKQYDTTANLILAQSHGSEPGPPPTVKKN